MLRLKQPLLLIIGSSHKEANLNERETFSLDAGQLECLSNELIQQTVLKECLILNTCNRLELYAVIHEVAEIEKVHQSLCTHPMLKDSYFPKNNFIKKQSSAIEHCFALASGLASQMVGETEILGQIKQAYQRAKATGQTDAMLNRLFEKSFQAAKLIRSQTGISRGQISVGTVAVHLANRIFGAIEKSRILLIGSGEVSEKTAQALKNKGVSDITVSGRSKEKTDQLAEKFAAASIHFENFKSQIQHFDIVISSTAAPNYIIDCPTIERSIAQRPNRPLFLIDLAVPRDIEARIADLDNVYLYNLDALARIANENKAQRKREIEKATQIVKAQAWNFWLQHNRRQMYELHQ